MRKIISLAFLNVLLFTGISCSSDKTIVIWDFNKIPDRIWAGEDFWTVPLEDWCVKNGRIECNSPIQNATFSILPYSMAEKEAPFFISVEMGLNSKGNNDGSSGLSIGVKALEEADIRSSVYFGKGVNLGVNSGGYAFLGQQIKELPKDFDFSKFRIELSGKSETGGFRILMNIFDGKETLVAELSTSPETPITGIVQLINNIRNTKSKNNGPTFWFDNLKLSGEKFEIHPENRFGPVLWSMFTLSRNTLKITAQLPPVGKSENDKVELQLKENNNWQTVSEGKIDSEARCVTFKLVKWDATVKKDYRITYKYNDVFGEPKVAEYSGIIQKEPLDRPLRMGALTCQYGTAFPYSPLVKNLKISDPDLLYFSGDQIYEGNGGYQIKRSPEETAILSYLGKYYMFGWAFGDLMRSIPTIATPDDHDVFQGNLWGEEGRVMAKDGLGSDDHGGFVQTKAMVNVVNRTQCAHLPDPYDPTPIEQGINVWFTDLNYGSISFAIVTDRIFKSGPDRVTNWEGRKDHLKAPLKDPSSIETPGLEFLGKRQEDFLKNWVKDWRGVDMKVLLSQTLFANVATHHGQYISYLFGDMDSGGWPKTGRDRAIQIIRKGFVFQIAGDQHVPSIVHYGIDNYRDAGWCYITPAISVGYSRWFRPDEMGIQVKNRPTQNLPNTGEYKDAFGNLNYVYAIGNPGNFKTVENRFQLAQEKASGYGMIIFDSGQRTIKMESWRFLTDVENPVATGQFPGWPLTISQFDNYGREAVAWLPTLKITGEPNPVVEVINTKTGETEYIVRIKGNEFSPKVFSNDTFTIRVGYPEKEIWKIFENVTPDKIKNKSQLTI